MSARSARKKQGRLKWRTIIIPFSTLQFWVSFLLVLLAVGALAAFIYLQFLSPRAHAGQLISKAGKQFDQAIVLGIKDLAFDEFQTAQETLFQARKAYDKGKNTESQVFAEQTLATLDKAIQRLRSDDFYKRERFASMSHLRGTVEVNLAGSLQWTPAKRGMKLKRGDKVRTRTGSMCVVQFDDGSQLTIKSNSLVHIDELSEDIRTRTKSSAIKLLVSDVEASILRPTARGSRFTIETPGSVAQVRKARMSVRVNGDNETEYKLISGDVSVRAGNRDVRLGRNEVIRLAEGGKVISRGKLLGVPVPRAPGNLDWKVSKAPSISVRFSWNDIPGARSYRLVVGTDRYFSNIVSDRTGVKGTSAFVKNLKPGLYYWRVSSIDRRGRESLFSSFLVFRIVQDQTPPYFSMGDPIVFSDPSEDRIYVSGAVEPGSKLVLNGKTVTLPPDGVFRSFLTMRKGLKAISIRATDPAGNVLSQQRVVR
ncbi:fecR protein [bacterium BMS3Abin14]|nr:fecR protein [bacterium BMS3Abin14]